MRAIGSRIDMASATEDFAARVDFDNAGLASAAAFHPSGIYLFVALETSREVAVMDAHGKRELLRVATGRAPQGVSVAADGKTLWVMNFMDRGVSQFDLRPLVETGELTLPVMATLKSIATEKLAPTVLLGKQLFYDARDARLAREGYISCASCHSDGGQDGRAWDMTGFGEGVRNTIALAGRGRGHGPMHWTANFDEAQDFEAQIRRLNFGHRPPDGQRFLLWHALGSPGGFRRRDSAPTLMRWRPIWLPSPRLGTRRGAWITAT